MSRHAALIEEGRHLQRRGELDLAQNIYDSILSEDAEQFDALYLRGVIAFQRGDAAEALRWYQRAIAADPTRGEIHFNHGNALRELKRFPDAEAAYRRAVDFDGNDAQAHASLGLALQALDRLEEAHGAMQRAVASDVQYANGHYYLGSLLEDLGRITDALASYQRALALKPDFPFLEGVCMHLRMRLSDWSDFDQSLARLHLRVAAGEQAVSPLAWFALSDSVELQRRCAETWGAARVPIPTGTSAGGPVGRGRIRIGYYSADFHDHATAFLMAELFERHDRERFEIIAFSFGIDSSAPMRQRLRAAFDQFHEVRERSDGEIAEQSRQIGIDIAVDLKGFTGQSRPGIFAAGAASIQIAYLGFPATMAAPYIDYLVADATLIDPSTRHGYSEHIITLPGTYQVNASQRLQGRPRSRSEVGLPEATFVFCSFNNNYKILPQTFALWMRILRRVDQSVLWLFEDNAVAATNLRQAAVTHGIDPARLVFAPREPQAEHIMRQGLGDLFLDTYPYNAHTTASDALWAGLPILTRAGPSFASRVAASLLAAVGLSELVVDNDAAYENLAVALAGDRQRLSALRSRLMAGRERSGVFDSGAFARKLEAAYTTAFDRKRSGLPPADFRIGNSK